MLTTSRSVVGYRKRGRASVLTDLAQGLGHDLRADLGPPRGAQPAHKEGILGETRLRIVEASRHVLGCGRPDDRRSPTSNLALSPCEFPEVEKQPRVVQTIRPD